MRKNTSRNMYKVLNYMCCRKLYPDGISQQKLNARFDANIISELIYYDYLETVSAHNIRITVQGREALKVHILTVTNVVTAVVAAAVAVLALFL